jgi:hypothetical protein
VAHALSAAAAAAAAQLMLSLHPLTLARYYLPETPHKHRGYRAMAVVSLISLLRVQTNPVQTFCCCAPCIAGLSLCSV